MFAKMKVTHKLNLLLSVMLFGLIVMTGINLYATKSLMVEDRKASLKSLVQANKKTLEHYYNKVQSGELKERAAKEAAFAALRYVRYNTNDYIFGYDYDGVALISPKEASLGKNYIKLKDPNGVYLIKDLIAAAKEGGGYVDYAFPKAGEKQVSPKLGYAESFEPWKMMVGTGVYIDDLEADFVEKRNIQLAEALAIVLIVITGGFFVSKSIGASLKIQDRVKAFEETVSSVISGVSSAATEMQSSAQSLASTADETTRQASAVGSASESAANGVQTVASAAEELNASIGEITSQTSETVRVARECLSEAENTSADVRELSKAAEDIGIVVSLIENIAGQVNLLALNATIEAARAGEAGKGFAVVANEVKNLAAQTGDATKDIVVQVSNIQEKTNKAVESISTISNIIKQVNEISTTVASAAEEQGAATQEISRSVQTTSQDTNEVSQSILSVREAAEETNVASVQMLATAGQLAQESETLRGTVEEFIDYIRKI